MSNKNTLKEELTIPISEIVEPITINQCQEFGLWDECELCALCKETHENEFIYGKKTAELCTCKNTPKTMSDSTFMKTLNGLIGNHPSLITVSARLVQFSIRYVGVMTEGQVNLVCALRDVTEYYTIIANTTSRKTLYTRIKNILSVVRFNEIPAQLRSLIKPSRTGKA